MKKVSIIIPIFNGISNTIECLKSIQKISYNNFNIIIVDDASTDNSAEIIKQEFKNVTILNGTGSLWWSGGVNEGIKHAIKKKADYILLLNNDNIVKTDFLDKLLELSECNPNDIIASTVFNLKNDQLIHAGGYNSNTGLRLYNDDFNKLEDEEIIVEWCGGMGTLIPKHVFEDVGYFDETEFPQYYGDADFMFRSRQKGYKILVCKESIIWNNVESTGLQAKVSTYKDLVQVLTSIKSNNNIKVNIRFYKKYFRTDEFIKIIFFRYAYIFGGFAKRNLYNLLKIRVVLLKEDAK